MLALSYRSAWPLEVQKYVSFVNTCRFIAPKGAEPWVHWFGIFARAEMQINDTDDDVLHKVCKALSQGAKKAVTKAKKK